MSNTDTPQLVYVNIHSKLEWKQWYRIAKGVNQTYVINHDPDIWHASPTGEAGFNVCTLHKRIQGRFHQGRWAGAKCLVRHDSYKNLWVTLKFPDNFCIGECGKRVQLHKSECASCKSKRWSRERPFYDSYPIKEITVITSDFERGYRLFKYMDVKEKLVLHHYDCNNPDKCYHFQWMMNRQRIKGVVPFFRIKVQGTQTEMVKIFK